MRRPVTGNKNFPPVSSMLTNDAQRLPGFEPVCQFFLSEMMKGIAFGFTPWRQTCVASSRCFGFFCFSVFFAFCFRQRRYQGFWFWWIGLTNVLSTAASSDPAELKRNQGGYGAPQQLSLSQGGIIYWHIYIPPSVTSWQSQFPAWNVASLQTIWVLEIWGNKNVF